MTHLHPAASRALWKVLSELPGQKLVATHSGDLLARVPLANVRRFCHDGAGIVVRRLGADTLDKEDARKMALHVKATRGELLFARSWLLVEGATEVWVFEGIADLLGIDLEREGVRIVQYAQVRPEPFIRLGDDLGIGWFCVADGDAEGEGYRKAAAGLLNGRHEPDHVRVLPDGTIEVHLCNAGFGSVYEGEVAFQKKGSITTKPGDAGYWGQVVDASPKRGKEARAIKVLEEMVKRGPASAPPFLKSVLDAVVQLAKGPKRGP